MTTRTARLFTWLTIVWVGLAGGIEGCQKGAQPSASRPTQAAEDQADVTSADQPMQDTAAELPKTPAEPKRPEPSWIIFREAFEASADATCVARWTGGNRLEVDTENIRGLTVDLHKLPPDAPQSGPWNLQIDGQGIEITGFRGKVVALVRSQNGIWSVDRSKGRSRSQ